LLPFATLWADEYVWAGSRAKNALLATTREKKCRREETYYGDEAIWLTP
jgi:hypothetical protein